MLNLDLHFHRRNLPHIYKANSTYFVTFRIKGSISGTKLNELRHWKEELEDPQTKEMKYYQESLFFSRYDKILDKNKKITILNNYKIAQIISKILHKYDGKDYNLIAYSIMPNHVHLVISTDGKSKSLDKIMHKIKRISAFQINKVLKRRGKFWQSESYDHIVRNMDELIQIIGYVLNNPVKAGLVKKWEDWKFNYLSYLKS